MKKQAAEKALEFIEDGMTIGLGTGSTVEYMLKKLEELVKKGLQIEGIPTSVKTKKQATNTTITLTSFALRTMILPPLLIPLALLYFISKYYT